MHCFALDEDANQAGDVFDGLVILAGKGDAFRPRPAKSSASMRMPLCRKRKSVSGRSSLEGLRHLRLLRPLVAESLGKTAIRIDSAVAEKRPMRAAEFNLGEVAVDDHHFFVLDRRAFDDLPVR